MAGALSGDPVEVGMPPATEVDVLALAGGVADPAFARGELLEGSSLAPGRSSMRGCWWRAGADAGFDVVISNGVINLSPAKHRVFAEAALSRLRGREHLAARGEADRSRPFIDGLARR